MLTDGIIGDDIAVIADRKPFARFVAVGDSFTEGLNDEIRGDGRHRGWADRVAELLVSRQNIEQLAYANLAIRGRLMRQIVDEQVPHARALKPDLVSVGAGVNDVLRRSFSLDTLCTDLENSVRQLTVDGSHVLLFAYGDPSRRSKAIGRVVDRMRAYRSATLDISAAYRCTVVDFWGIALYDDTRLWSADRLHLSPMGHRLTAEAVMDALGLGSDAWRSPVSDPLRPGWSRRRAYDAAWLLAHAGPWVTRRIRGVSSGAGVVAKDPTYRTVHKAGTSIPPLP